MNAPAETHLRIAITLPSGDATVSAAFGAVGSGARGTIVIAHGAGAGMDHPFLTGFADAIRLEGFSTMRFNFPYLEAGRRMPGPAAHAIATWRAVMDHARELGSGPLIACGKSYGGRMASMAVAEGMHADALVYLGYPLHAPGKPESPRASHLPAITVPQLFVEGTNDPFIQPLAQFEEVVAGCQNAQIDWIDGGGHTFEVKGHKRPADEIGASLAPVVANFLDGSVGGSTRR